jgi:hypothetical protein
LARRSDIADSAILSSCSEAANSFTVLMFEIVSTTCPVTIACAPARAASGCETRGRKSQPAGRRPDKGEACRC